MHTPRYRYQNMILILLFSLFNTAPLPYQNIMLRLYLQNKFRVYLGVITCDISLCFRVIVFLLNILFEVLCYLGRCFIF